LARARIPDDSRRFDESSQMGKSTRFVQARTVGILRDCIPLDYVPSRYVRGCRTMGQETASHTGSATVLDMERLEQLVPQLHQRYVSARPFPHIVLDHFLPSDVARRAIKAFPRLDTRRWNNYVHANEQKFSNTQSSTWDPTLQSIAEELASPRFVRFLGDLTGVDDLFADESMERGGLHQSIAGGFLNIHADFTVHPSHRNWRRRVNLLLYLNDEWPAEYGGELELWSTDMKRCEKRIAPLGNRVVIFNTEADSFHGHPDPLRCPPGTARQSMALYYFTRERNPLVRSTEYRARPGDGARAFSIYLDKQAVRSYERVRRWFGLSDDAASRLLRRLRRFRRR
jgi:hypothetical protein